MEREWARYEGTAQRRLFRELRLRFLERHRGSGAWVLDVGSGPGRFLGALGTTASRRVALDLSLEMLREGARGHAAGADLVRGDGLHPPFSPGRFAEVAVLGNALGFAGAGAEQLLATAASMVAPGGRLVLELVAGPGEVSRYLQRLPPSALVRLLRAPVAAVTARVEREGFRPLPPRKADPGEFRRLAPPAVAHRLSALGFTVAEVTAVAPALGADGPRLEAIGRDAKAWEHLLALEEHVGAVAARQQAAAAVLLAAVAPSPPERGIK